MGKNQKRLALSAILLLAFPLTAVHAAKPVDLNHQEITVLQDYIPSHNEIAKHGLGLKEVSRTVDFKKTLHVRVKETYLNYPVWGGDAIIHIPNDGSVGSSLQDVYAAAEQKGGSLDGTLYQDINKDLVGVPHFVFTATQAQKALNHAIDLSNVDKRAAIKDQQSELIVFVDEQHKAHWAFKVSFYAEPVISGEMPVKPNYILDAQSFDVYANWNDIQTLETEAVFGGGYGGNKKMGQLVYDGLGKNLSKLKMTKDGETCTLQNTDVTVKHYRTNKLATFACTEVDTNHNNVYWDGSLDAVNGGYSPDNDALFGGAVIKDMYLKWYGIPVLTENGKPMMLNMIVHDPIDNAFWDGKKMTFGDGVRMFYPLTSIGVAAHEVSHGFTQQHSNLTYYGQSGGMNEAFSDMAAQAAEFFAFGKNSWQIGPEIFKKENEALRYMDQPSKDCKGRRPGDRCSIDTADQYRNGLDVHYSSGVYNHFFYLLGTTKGWDAKKAFDVMVHANMSYWTSSATFANAACGVLKATKDLGFKSEDVVEAFKGVKIDTSSC